MKLIKVLLILAVVFAMLGVPKPAAAVIYTYTSGYQVQNLSSSQATVTLTYYNQQTTSGSGGAQAWSGPDTIPASGSKTYFPVHAPAGFKGSVVISSSAPLASIANLVASGVGNASYVGFSSGSKLVYLPLLMKVNAGITTWYSVQNTGATDTSVSVAYSDGTTAGPIVIKPSASYVFDQGTETHPVKIFAATLTSTTENVVVVEVQEGTINKTISAMGGFDGGETNALMPLINANNAGYATGVQIQNIGASSTDVTVSYTPVPGIGTACWETHTIAAGKSVTFALAAFAGVLPAAQSNCTTARFVGSAQVTANTASMPVVAVVNQTTGKIGSAYDSFVPSKVTAKVVFPIIMDHNNGWYTGFNLANVGADSVHVVCTFTNNTYKIETDLAAGAVLNDIQFGKLVPAPYTARYVGSGTCLATGTGETKIVGVVNEVAPGTGDILLTYEGINVAP